MKQYFKLLKHRFINKGFKFFSSRYRKIPFYTDINEFSKVIDNHLSTTVNAVHGYGNGNYYMKKFTYTLPNSEEQLTGYLIVISKDIVDDTGYLSHSIGMSISYSIIGEGIGYISRTKKLIMDEYYTDRLNNSMNRFVKNINKELEYTINKYNLQLI